MIRKKLIYLGLLTVFIMTATACNNKSKTDNNQKTTVSEATVESDQTSEGATAQSDDTEETVPIDESVFKQVVVEVGKEDVYYSEAMIYFKYIQAQYESYFGNQIWSYDFDGQTFGNMAKTEIMNMITQTKIIGAQAEDYNVVLTDEDEALIQQNAKEFLAGLTEEDKLRYGLTEEVAQKFYRDNKLYESVYDAATMDVNTDVTDEEAKQITVQHVLVLTTETDSKGTLIPLSDKKKQDAYAKIKKLLKEGKKAEDFKTFAEANTEDSQVEYTFGKGEMESTYEQAAFALKSGELSSVVETDKGYYIIYCVSDYNEDATLEKKEEIIADRQDKYFQTIYEKWAKKNKIDINHKVWDTMNFEIKPVTQPTEEPTVSPTVTPAGD